MDGGLTYCRKFGSTEADDKGGTLPPSCIAEPSGIHLAHIPHSNYSHYKAVHLGVE
jgi:hypothetical protein